MAIIGTKKKPVYLTSEANWLGQVETQSIKLIPLSELSVVILNYNGAKFLLACLTALVKAGYPDKVCEIIVVDNASSDNSLEIVQPFVETAEVNWVETGANLGYGGGSNFSFTITRGSYIVVLNPDVVIQPGCLEQMLQALQTVPRIGILGCKLLYPFEDEKQARIQHLAGSIEYPLALTKHLGNGLLDSEQDSLNLVYNYTLSGLNIIEAEYVTGALIMFRRAVITEIGGYDERFSPAYFEETDLCRRAANKGWRVASCLSARAVHHESGTLGSASFDYFYCYHSNRLRFILKHYSQSQLIKDFLPAESSRFKEMCGSMLDQNETAKVERVEARALTQVYLELEKSGENKLSQFQEQPIPSSDFVELDHKLKLLVGLTQLESGARSVNNNWRLLTQPGLVRRPVAKGIFWREPRRTCETILEKCRVAYYRRFTMPHILELAAAQERFNVAVTRQVDQLTYLVGQLVQAETNISGSETPLQVEKALESLRQGIYLVGNNDSEL